MADHVYLDAIVGWILMGYAVGCGTMLVPYLGLLRRHFKLCRSVLEKTNRRSHP